MDTSLADRFAAGTREFATSPLYQRLAAVVAADEDLLGIAEHCRAGQQPTNLVFAAVHYLLLGGASGPLADWYPSLGGTRRPDDPALPGAFTDFCTTHRAELIDLVSHRLVQTHVVKRSAALRLGLAAVAAEAPGGPVTLLEVGASGGIHLSFDRYRCVVGDTVLGPDSPVRIEVEWRSTLPVPTGQPEIGARLGVDLDPVDLTDPDARRWLRALVWPENGAQAEMLEAAALLVADRPPRLVRGEATESLPALDAELPTDRPLVVWHAATRAHVPAERRGAFDDAVAALGRRRRLYTLSLETPHDADAWTARYGVCYALELRVGDGPRRCLAAAEGHLNWILPRPGGFAP